MQPPLVRTLIEAACLGSLRVIGRKPVDACTHGYRLTILGASGDLDEVVLAEHTLVGPGEASVLDAHYGGPRPATPPRAVRPKTATEKVFCVLGPVAEALTGRCWCGTTSTGLGHARQHRAAPMHIHPDDLPSLVRPVHRGLPDSLPVAPRESLGSHEEREAPLFSSHQQGHLSPSPARVTLLLAE